MAHFVVYSDYLCPWCYNLAVRLERLRDELGGELQLEWRSFLLRPKPRSRRDLEAFRAYTQSWRAPAAEPDAPEFRTWQGEAGPPSHSVPPHLVAKAAAQLGREAFESVHRRLLRAYFAESRDITSQQTLRALWEEAGLPGPEFQRSRDPQLLQRVLGEHAEAVESGVTGVPAVRAADADICIVGAHPLELYHRWVERLRSA